MANGRIYSKHLDQDLKQSGISDALSFKVVRLHLNADDEGYITLEDAKYFAKIKNPEILQLKKCKFIEIEGNLLKILRWNKYQKIPPSKFRPSNLKNFWPKNENKDDGEPLNYKEYLKTLAEKMQQDSRKNSA